MELRVPPFSLLTAFGLSLVLAAVPVQSVGQALARTNSVPAHALPLSHLYWHFLMYQNYLDSTAAQRQASGQDAGWLRNSLQKKIGLSDQDYASVRISSSRLAGKVHSLDAEAARIRSFGSSPQITAQLKQLTLEREADINAEVDFLRATLPPRDLAQFELFLKDFFRQPNATLGAPAVPAAV